MYFQSNPMLMYKSKSEILEGNLTGNAVFEGK